MRALFRGGMDREEESPFLGHSHRPRHMQPRRHTKKRRCQTESVTGAGCPVRSGRPIAGRRHRGAGAAEGGRVGQEGIGPIPPPPITHGHSKSVTQKKKKKKKKKKEKKIKKAKKTTTFIWQTERQKKMGKNDVLAFSPTTQEFLGHPFSPGRGAGRQRTGGRGVGRGGPWLGPGHQWPEAAVAKRGVDVGGRWLLQGSLGPSLTCNPPPKPDMDAGNDIYLCTRVRTYVCMYV